jgi:moderate conductance mechanosensitive channel
VIVAVQPLTDVSLWLRGSGLEIVLIVTGTVLLTRFIRWFGERIGHRIDDRTQGSGAPVRSEGAKHRRALTQVLAWTVVVLVYCVSAVLVLSRFDVPLSGLIAPAAVAGAALGLGGQRVVADVLAGFFVIAERQYGIGDVIRLQITGAGGQTVTGTVEDVTLRVTRIRTTDGEVVITPNGVVIQVTNLSRDWARTVIDVPVPAGTDITAVTAILQRSLEEAQEDEDLAPLLLDTPSVMGVESFSVDQLNVRVIARTLPGQQFAAGRLLRARLAAALQEEGVISAPKVNAEAPSGEA